MNETQKTVHFNEEVIIIEYDVNDRICKKDNILKRILQYITLFIKKHS